MSQISVFDMTGKKVADTELNDAIFGIEPNKAIMHAMVVNYLANQRQGTQSTLTRTEVRGGGRKPWRQKGTGHARQGSTRAPQWTGGGVVFAPVPRDYSFKMNKKEKAAAMRSVLSSKVSENKFFVIDEIQMDEYKTKKIIAMLEALGTKKALIVLDNADEKVIKSAANIQGVKTSFIKKDEVSVSATLSVYDVLKYDTVVIVKNAAKNIEEVYA